MNIFEIQVIEANAVRVILVEAEVAFRVLGANPPVAAMAEVFRLYPDAIVCGVPVERCGLCPAGTGNYIDCDALYAYN